MPVGSEGRVRVQDNDREMEAGEAYEPECDARLDRLPATRWRWKIFLMSGLGILFAWSNYISGLVLAQLSEIGWVDTGSSAVFTSAYMAGMFFGSLVGGMIGDAIGRRKSYLLFVGLHTLTMYLAAVSPNIVILTLVRAIMGFGLGALLVTLFAAFSEYVPAATRGTWMGRNSFLGNCSNPISSLLATILTPLVTADMNWRLMFVIPAVLSTAVWIWAWFRYPESPRWLESKGRCREAEDVMRRIESEVEQEYGSALPPIKEGHGGSRHHVQHVEVPYRELFHGILLRRVILGAFVLIAMNVTAYTLMTWLPTILLLKGIDINQSFVLYTVMAVGAPAGAFLAMELMDRCSRKVMGIGLLLIMAIVGPVFAFQENYTTICILGFLLQVVVEMYVVFSSGVYVPEIWPTEVRMRGSGLANSIGRVSGILTPFAVSYLLACAGAPPVFAMMSIVAIVTTGIIAFLGIDTRGMTAEEIENATV